VRSTSRGRNEISALKRRNRNTGKTSAYFQDPYCSYNIFHKIDSVLMDAFTCAADEAPTAKKWNDAEACSFVNLKFDEMTNK